MRSTSRAPLYVAAGVLATAFPWIARGADPTGQAVMDSVENREEGKDERATVTLEVKPERGTPRVRRFMFIRKTYDDQKKYMTFFIAPADVRNSVFMVWDQKKDEDRRWLFLPSIGQIRRLTTGDERTSFFGTDLLYEDINNRDSDLDTHQLVGSEKYNEWDCWVVESTPKNAGSVEFSKYKSWVWKQSPLILRQEFLDKAGKLERKLEIVGIAQPQGIWTVYRGSVSNLKTGSRTRLQFDDVKYDNNLADEVFTESQMKRGMPSL